MTVDFTSLNYTEITNQTLTVSREGFMALIVYENEVIGGLLGMMI